MGDPIWTPSDIEPPAFDQPPGDRYTANRELLEIERQLIEDGVCLANPAMHISQHPEFPACNTGGESQ